MDWLRRLSWAFAAGCVGVIGFYIGLRLSIEAGIIKGPEPMMTMLTSKGFFYSRLTWGGIWGFLFAVPLLTGKWWWLRGLIVGFLATLVAILVFQPQVPPVAQIISMLVLNMVFYGLVAGFWHDKVMFQGEGGSKGHKGKGDSQGREITVARDLTGRCPSSDVLGQLVA